MKLTKTEKQILLDIGATKEDCLQIERAIPKTDFVYNQKNITSKEATEILGVKTFLSGMFRAAFHWSAVRQSDSGDEVYFSCRRFLNKAFNKNTYKE